MKITNYKLLLHRADEMEDKVNVLIEQEQWQPFGPPFVLPPTPDLEGGDMLYQAMVKYAND